MPAGRAGDPRARTTSARWTTSSPPSTCGARSASWPSRSCSATAPQLHLPPRRGLPGPPRPSRRGGLHDRAHDPRPRRLHADVRRGGRSRSGELGEPRPGVGRIALESGVPVVPVAIHGSAGVRGWKRLRFPKVTVQYGEPMRSTASRTRRASSSRRPPTQVFDRVREMYVGARGEGPPRRDQGPARGRSGGSADASAAASPQPALGLLVARRRASPDARRRGSARSPRPGTARGRAAAPAASASRWRSTAAAARARRRAGAACRRRRRRSRSRGSASGTITHWWPARVARRVGEPDAAVAEQVVGAAEGRVGVDAAAVEVDRAVVEGVVVVRAAGSRATSAASRSSRTPTRPR